MNEIKVVKNYYMRITLQIGLVFFLSHLFAQEPDNFFIEDMITSYAEMYDTEPDEEQILDYEIQRSKININRAAASDLSKIPILTPDQINNLTEYLDRYGEVFSLFELQAVEGFDSVTIRKLFQYIEIGSPPPIIRLTPGNLIRLGHHDAVFRYQQVMQKQEGYVAADSVQGSGQDNFYLGKPQRYYFRYRYSFYDQVVIGISGDKDAGEEFFKGSQPAGMDYYSWFVAVRNLRWLKQVIAGNFRVSFGQGLTLGGSSFGSSVSFGTGIRYHSGFTPSQSACEYGYLRGVALTLSTGRVEWSGFLSYTRKEATMDQVDTSVSRNFTFTSFSETGYHRTPSEVAKKNSVGEWIYGGHASYRGDFFLIGLTAFYGKWSGSLMPKQEVYRHFMLHGNRFGALGIDGRCRIGFSQFFGEVSVSLNGGLAWLAGITAVPVSGIDLLLVYRDYQPQFQNPFSTAVSQNNMTANEHGFFIKVQTQLLPKTTISGYADIYRFPWLRYRVNSPSNGMEAGLMGCYQPSSFWSFTLWYNHKRGAMNSSDSRDNIMPLDENRRNDFKATVTISPNAVISLRSCLELLSYQITGCKPETGYLGSQEITYHSTGLIRSARLKYTLFDIPFYNTRIYSYEPGPLYSFSAPVFYGRGFRTVFLLQAEIARRVDLWGWVGVTKYVDRNSIGSGLEKIDGSIKSEVKVQLRVRL